MKVKPNFVYPRVNTKIKIIGKGFDEDRYGYYVRKNESGQLILDMDPTNILPESFKYETLNLWDDFEVLT